MLSKKWNSLLFIILIMQAVFTGCGNDYINRAGQYYIEGDVEKGIQTLQTAIKEDSTNARAYYNLGNFNLESGNFQLAIDALKKASDLYSKNADSKTASGLGAYPRYYESIDNLALAYLVTGKYPEAIKLANEASQPGYDNDQPAHTVYLANILSGNTQKGLEQFEYFKRLDAVQETIKDDSVLINLFLDKKLSETAFLSYLKALFSTASPQKALLYLDAALKELPENPVFLALQKKYTDPGYNIRRIETMKTTNDFLNAKSLANNGQLERADKVITGLVEKNPDNVSIREFQAMVKFKMLDWPAALGIYRSIIKTDPNMPGVWYNLGCLYSEMDSLNKAELCFIKALELNPKYPEANSNLGSLYGYRDKDDEKAILFFKKEMEVNPGNGNAYFNAGLVYFRLKNFSEAVNSFKKTVEINPYDIEARQHLVDSYEKNGDKTNSILIVKSSIEFMKKEKVSQKFISLFEARLKQLEN